MTTRAPDYGLDLSCTFTTSSVIMPDASTRTFDGFDVTEDFATVSGRTLLAEALVRRLVTPRGTLIDDADYGTDVRRWINDDVDDRIIAGTVAAEIDAELQKDERVRRSTTTASFTNGLLTTTTSIIDASGPFRLVLRISDVTIEVLEAPQ